MKYLLLSLLLALTFSCKGENGEIIIPQAGECHAVYSQVATFDLNELPLPLNAITHRMELASADCTFLLPMIVEGLPYSVDMVVPFTTKLDGHDLVGDLTRGSATRFSYTQMGGPFESTNNTNCAVELKGAGDIDLDGSDVSLGGDLELWFSWSENGSPCFSWELLF